MKYKNKIISTILVIMLALSTTVLTSCGDDKNTDSTQTTTTSSTKNSTDKNTKNTTDEIETETRTEVVTDDEGEVVDVITIVEPVTDAAEKNNNNGGSSNNSSSSGNSGSNSSSGNSGTGSGTTKPTQKPTEKPTQKPTEKPTEKPTQPPTEPPTNPPTEPPTEAPTEPPVNSPYIYPFDPYTIEQDMINYGISQGLTYDSSLTFGNCGYNAPFELSSSYFVSSDLIGLSQSNCFGKIDSVVNLMIRETGTVEGARFRPYLEPLPNGGYLVYCFYG